MQTVIYADLLVIMNTVITLIIIIITSDLLKIDSAKTRYIAGALTGGFFSLIILAPPMNRMLTVAVRVFIAVIIVLLSFKPSGVRLYLKCFLMFNGVSLLLAGIMLVAGMLISNNSVVANNGYIYADFGISAIILIICASLFLIKIINNRFFSKSADDLIFDVEIYFSNRKINVKALYDSGNNLTDMFTGKPVIIVSLCKINPLLDKNTADEIKNYFAFGEFDAAVGKIRLLPARTLGYSCFIPAFSADKAIISGNETVKILEKPSIAVTDNSFDENKYSALINNAVIGQVI